MIVFKCHVGCSQTTVMEALRHLGAWGPGISDQTVIDALHAKRCGGYFMARCPGHDDSNPSLSIRIEAGEGPEVPWGDPVAVYRYCDEDGRSLYEFARWERYVDGRREKKLRPRLPGATRNGIGDVRRVIYRLPEVLASESVFVVEGEKDVEALRSHGFVGTCNPFGAGKWKPDYNEAFRGKEVIVFPDADLPGRNHAADVVRNLLGIAASVCVVELAGAKDIADWFAAGHSEVEFLQIVESEAVN